MRPNYDRGIFLPGPDLWLDPQRVRTAAVVSHGHSDHVQGHEEVISSAATAAFMRCRGLHRCRYLTLPFREPWEHRGARLTLYPAGHILGSAQVLVEWEGRRLLYSGDFKLRRGRSAEEAEVPEADEVIMETTFGLPRYRFPEPQAVVGEIAAFCRQALEQGVTPVLLCYSLGKGQEVLASLEGLKRPIYLHGDHWEMAELYRGFGVSFPPYRRYELSQAGPQPAGVLLCAPGCRRSSWFRRLGRHRTAFLSGWAIDPGASRRFGADAAFPLSDHADYDGLLEYVERTGARRIHTLHGFAGEFAGDLRRRGLWAEPLRAPGPQLSLFPPEVE